MTQSEEIYKELAKDFKISKDIIEAIVRSQFEMIHDAMEFGDIDNPESFRSIRLQYFGVFKCNKINRDRKIKKIKAYRDKQEK